MENNIAYKINNKDLIGTFPELMEFKADYDGLTFAYEEVEAARAEGYNRGFSEGIDLGITQGEMKAIRDVDIAVQEILMQLQDHLLVIIEQEKVFIDNYFVNILKICNSVLSKSMPFFFKDHGKQELEQILVALIKSLINPTPIKVHVAKDTHTYLMERMEQICATFNETIEVIIDENLSGSACYVDWQGGGAKWSLDERYQEIENKLEIYINKVHAVRELNYSPASITAE